MSDEMSNFTARFQKAFVRELSESVYLHYFESRKHGTGSPIPEPEDAAEDIARQMANEALQGESDANK